MPRVSKMGLPDELLLKHLANREELSDEIRIKPAQLALILGRSLDQLQDDRATGKPPPPAPKKGREAVRYRLGDVRAHLFGDDASRSTARTKTSTTVRSASIAEFITSGDLAEQWPFTFDTQRGRQVLIEFFESIKGAEALSDHCECMLLSIEELFNRRQAIEAANANAKNARKAASQRERLKANAPDLPALVRSNDNRL